jgi:UDP-N-acetyl-2-amino-2-deoxyglucuronate dehydrogenase
MLKDIVKITYNLDEVAESLEEGIRFLKEHDLDSAEIRTIDGKNIAKLSLKETKELKHTLDANGLKVSAIASPLFKWYADVPSGAQSADLFGMSPHLSRKEKEEMIAKVLEQAVILGTERIRIFSGLKSGDGFEDLLEEDSELMSFALRIAKDKGVRLLLENEPVCHISRLDEYIKIFTSGKYEGLRAWFDIANVYEEGESVLPEHLRILAPYIDYLHVKDPIAPKAHQYTPLGDGYINYKRIFTLLESFIQNPLVISIETHVKTDKGAASSKSLDYLRNLLSSKRAKFALVGIGRISKKHFAALKSNDNCALMGVFDINTEKAQLAAHEHDCTEYSSFADLLKDDQVNVVSICTPHDVHISLTEDILKQGKKVLCEKPFALSVMALEQYIARFGESDNIFVVFQNRFNPAVKEFYKFRKETLGDPQYIAMTLRWWRDIDYYADWHGDREKSGGALITQAIHSIELVTYLTDGSAIKSVKSIHLKTRSEITTPDLIVALVEFENGVICNMEVCLATRSQNLESSIFVVGTKGSVKIGGVALSEFIHPQREINEQHDQIEHYYGGGHAALYKTLSNHLLGILDQDGSLLTRPKDLLPVLKFIEAVDG